MENVLEGYDRVRYILDYEGEHAKCYVSKIKYVEERAFEKDYFKAWIESKDTFPDLETIKDFCESLSRDILLLRIGIELGVIKID